MVGPTLLDAATAANDNVSTVVVASVISSIVAAIAAILTSRSSSKSNQIVAETTTRGDIEVEASQRTAKLYNELIDRQASEIAITKT